MRRRTSAFFGGIALVASLVLLPSTAAAQRSGSDIPRTPDGRPDLSGTYDTATLTPVQRPAKFGDRLHLTEEELAVARSQPAGIVQVFGLAARGASDRR